MYIICKFIFKMLNNSHIVDPAFRLMRFPLDDKFDFYSKMILFIKKKYDLESLLIFVLFLKG